MVEKAPDYADAGYAIGLYPLGSCVLHGLGVYDELVARSVESTRYEIADQSGRVLQAVDMSAFTAGVGPLLMTRRTDLVDVLRTACGEVPIRLGTTVTALTPEADVVEVTLSDGTTHEVDLVVACDGVHSDIRALVFGPPDRFDTGWVIWTWWDRSDQAAPDLVHEQWGRGSFLGVYPVPGRAMIAAGLPASEAPGPTASPGELRAGLARRLSGLRGAGPRAGVALEDVDELFAWPMADIRAPRWSSGRVVLCGDAGVAFLPTAGVGASNAMRSAAALADELSRADAAHVPLALELFEKRCRTLVEHNQDDSRSVARYMFVRSRALGWGRDQLVKHYPADRVVKQITASMHTPF